LKSLIEHGFDINQKISTGESGLIYSVIFNKVEVMKFLIENGININDMDNKYNTALIIASKIGNIEIVKYLIEKGIYIYAKDNQDRDSIIYALIFNHPNIVYYLFNKGDQFLKNNNKCIYYFKLACKNGFLDIAKYLIYNGVSINEDDINIFEENPKMKPKIEYIYTWIYLKKMFKVKNKI